MDVAQFVRKWAATKGGERATSQSHFLDLCTLLSEHGPTDADPSGALYAFEKGAKTRDGDGFADVWMSGNFAWEYKGKRKNLDAAYVQVQQYREALGNPPLLIVCDIDRYEIHTNWNTETWIYKFRNADIATDDPVEIVTVTGAPAEDAPLMTALQALRAIFQKPSPDALKPQKTRDEITRDAAKLFGEISDELRKWKVDDMRIARFITKVMFCMFATDVGLLPPETFSQVIKVHKKSGDAKAFREYLSRLFRIMNRGGTFMMQTIPQFNGMLFKDGDVPEYIDAQQVHVLERLDDLNWADVEPSIFGTLFERILDPDTRSALGAHYTSRSDMELIIEPVLMEPLFKEWRALRGEIAEAVAKASPMRGVPPTVHARLREKLIALAKKLATITVLDPACGSGNFLYVSLASLKALEQQVVAEADTLNITIAPKVHPRQLFGIEINPYAHELASIVIWIGYLQWKRRSGLPLTNELPILEALDHIQIKDAIVDVSRPTQPVEATWPAVDVVVGNPPFLGGKRLRTRLGDEYVEKMFAVYNGRVARESDLCCYFFEKAREAIEAGIVKRAGLLATQAIRGGANRKVLERIKETGDIFYAQADRPWVQDGVAVRVSMVGFDNGSEHHRLLNEATEGEAKHALRHARAVASINANLTFESDVTKAQRLKENVGVSFMGDTKVGPFDIHPGEAKKMLAEQNPHGRPNSDVVRPWVNGLDITRRSRGMWIVDFPPGMSEQDAAKYEAPFEFIKRYVKPFRAKAKSGDVTGVHWWIHQRPRPDMRAAVAGLNRYLGTPNLTKHRLFAWFTPDVLPDHQLIVFARSDDYFFGVLQSRAHQVWALLQGTQLENRPRYTPTTCFETFPFPHGGQQQQWAISIAAKDLNDLREGWLNPEGMIGAKELSQRTLTNLYNECPTWLANAHLTLDEAVFAAYGWRETPDDLPDAEIVSRLLALNLLRDPV